MSQLSYAIEHGAAYPGTRADSSPMRARAALNKSGAEIPFGRAVKIDAAQVSGLKHSSLIPIAPLSAAADVVAGVLLHDAVHLLGAEGVKNGDMGSVITQGSVNVIVEDAVTPASPVHVRVAVNGAGTAVGQFRGTADSTNTLALTNARFRGSASAGGVVEVELNLP